MERFKDYFEQRFIVTIEKYIAQSISFGATESTKKQLEYIQTLASAGKRFRPYAVDAAYRAQGGVADIFPILASIELLHIFALVHDDIMDGAHMRHGVATMHTMSAALYTDMHDTDALQRGISQGILIGDLIFTWSQMLFIEGIRTFDEKTKQKAYEVYSTLIQEVIVGQMIDVDISARTISTVEEVLQKNRLKSGNYTFVRPIILGTILGSSNPATLAQIEKAAGFLGEVFQAQDDLLDIFGVPGEKSLCTDVVLGQQTLVSAYMALQDSTIQQQFFGYKGKTLDQADIAAIQTLVIASGVRGAIEEIIRDGFAHVQSLAATLTDKEQAFFTTLCDIVATRKK